MQVAKGLDILIVEDNQGDWFLIKEYLSEFFSEDMIVWSKSLAEAILRLAERSFDIILLDLSLPDSLGTASVERLTPWCGDSPVMVLTGYSDEMYAKQSLKLGVQDYLVKDDLSATLLFKAIYYSIERNNARIKAVMDGKQKAMEISEAIISAQEKERLEFSIELHDNINQLLATSRLYLDLAQKEKENVGSHLGEADKILKLAIDEIRSLSHALASPSQKGMSFEEAIRELMERFAASTGVKFILNLQGISSRKSSEKIFLNIFRIVQEQLNNILKHSHADTVEIHIEGSKSYIDLAIKDNGVGFDTNKKKNGIGLENIQTRAAMFNGNMQVISVPPNGCLIKVRFAQES
ncbi:sensor histidine kinase [Flavitalea flava]